MSKIKTDWRNERHLQFIKDKLRKRLKETDYIVIVRPGYDLKSLRSLGFVIHRIVDDSPYNNNGYYKNSGDIPTVFRTITIKSKDELNYLKLSHPKAVYDYAQVNSICGGLGLYY